MTQVIALQRHPDIDVLGSIAEIQSSAYRLCLAYKVEPVHIVSYSRRKPAHSWAVLWSENMPAGAGGIHLDRNGVPFGRARPEEGLPAFTHEAFEMIVDPFGKRFTKFASRDYLVEVCDPWEGRPGLVSQWCPPDWYDGSQLYSRKLEPNGYVSWIEGGDWWQQFCGQDGRVTTRNLGVAVRRTRKEKDWLAAAVDW